MKIEYICHACMVIETEDLRIATDPWVDGAVYCGQWHVFPKPVNAERLTGIDAIFISHGHEDHLHEDTLRTLAKSAKVFYPYSFFGGAKEYIESIGFTDVTEAVTLKTYKVSAQTSVTFIVNSHDSIMVVESGGEVLVNVNDALHSSPEKVIDFYLDIIRERWKKIDYVFCGFGGASYFPNTIHFAGKDDWELGILREQLFAHNFCRVVRGLRPSIAVPFAADFALLADNQRWINEARFPRRKMADYYARYFAENGCSLKIYDMYSGDILESHRLRPLSPYRAEMKNGELLHLLDTQYANEILAKRKQYLISERDAAALIADTFQNVAKRMTLYKYEKLKNLKFCLRVTDLEKNNCVHIAFENETPKVWRSGQPEDDCLLTMDLTSKVLRYSIGSDWGADVVSIGYGAEIEFSASKSVELDLESVCMSLLACYPTISDLKKALFRTLQFLLLNPPKYTRSIRRLKKFHHESENYDRKTWLLNDVSEIRRRFNLPMLDGEFLPET
ncbi:MAG: MBL fold metallo-hydrolase [Pyrinomonadaceae bacterium]